MKNIEFRDTYYECGDGCCSEHYTEVYVDGQYIGRDYDLTFELVSTLLDELGVKHTIQITDTWQSLV